MSGLAGSPMVGVLHRRRSTADGLDPRVGELDQTFLGVDPA